MLVARSSHQAQRLAVKTVHREVAAAANPLVHLRLAYRKDAQRECVRAVPIQGITAPSAALCWGEGEADQLLSASPLLLQCCMVHPSGNRSEDKSLNTARTHALAHT